MNPNRIFERAYSPNPEVVCGDTDLYPLVSDEIFEDMYDDFTYYSDVPFFNLSLGKSADNKEFLDVYLWDAKFDPFQYKRFVFCDGMRLSAEDEDFLWDYLNENTYVDVKADSEVYGYLEKRKCLETDEDESDGMMILLPSPRELFERLYYTGHLSGCKEILYKAGLYNIGLNLHNLPQINLIGTTPETIIGYDLPLRLIRTLDNYILVNRLFSEESIENSKAVYERYKGYWQKNDLSSGQWVYLEELYREGSFCGRRYKKALFKRLANCDETELEYYRKYYNLMDEVGRRYPELMKFFDRLPESYNVYEFMKGIEQYCSYSSLNHPLNVKIARRKKQGLYEFQAEKYSVVLPSSAKEMVYEALEQKNCLRSYINDYADRDTTIVFLRRNEDPYTPFVTMEIKNNELIQVYAKCNSLPAKDVYVFLEQYTYNLGIKYNPFKLIGCYYNITKDLKDYLEAYRQNMDIAPDTFNFIVPA